jgi:uncharacterized membrane protein
MNKFNLTVGTAYLTIFGFVISYFLIKDRGETDFSKFHMRQALGMNLLFFAIGYTVSNFDNWMVTSSFYLFFFVLWGFGFSMAVAGQQTAVPILGQFFQKLFKNL